MRTILILASTTRRGRTRPTTGTDPRVRPARQGVHRAATIPRRVRPVPATITGADTDTDDELSFIWKRSQNTKSQKYTSCYKDIQLFFAPSNPLLIEAIARPQKQPQSSSSSLFSVSATIIGLRRRHPPFGESGTGSREREQWRRRRFHSDGSVMEWVGLRSVALRLWKEGPS